MITFITRWLSIYRENIGMAAVVTRNFFLDHTESASWWPFPASGRALPCNKWKGEGRNEYKGKKLGIKVAGFIILIWYFYQKTTEASDPEAGGDGSKQTGRRKRTAAPEFHKEKAFY